MRLRLIAILLLALGVSSTATSQSAPRAAVRAIPPDSMWRLTWIVGRDKSEGTFVEPRHVVVTGSLVVVLDMGTREVRGFDTRDGSAKFVLLPRGEGPGEFKRPAKLAATPDGFAVLDHATARLTSFDRAGRARWDFNVPEVFGVTGICVTEQRSVYLTYARRDSSVVRFDTTGRRSGTLRLPWTVPRPTPLTFAHEARTSAVNANGDCAVVPLFGREWALFSTGGQPRARVFSYREPGKEPIMRTSTRTLERTRANVVKEQINSTNTDPVANGVMMRNDTVVIVTRNARKRSYSLLDYYHAGSGRYLHSRNLPMTFTSLAIDESGTYFGTVITEKEQALIAMRPERLPATTPSKDTAKPTAPRPPKTPARPPAHAPAPPPTFR